MIEDLRKCTPIEEFDYQILLTFLKEYKKPRNKITQLLKDKIIIRVKKGLYVFGKHYRQDPICLEALANIIQGPSYISLEYALQYYNLIPERIYPITSITIKPNKTYTTPLGTFTYRNIRLKRYRVGVTYQKIDKYHSVYIATKEKALMDLLAIRNDLKNPQELYTHLIENLRIEEEDLCKFDLNHLYDIVDAYHTPTAYALLKVIRKIK